MKNLVLFAVMAAVTLSIAGCSSNSSSNSTVRYVNYPETNDCKMSVAEKISYCEGLIEHKKRSIAEMDTLIVAYRDDLLNGEPITEFSLERYTGMDQDRLLADISLGRIKLELKNLKEGKIK